MAEVMKEIEKGFSVENFAFFLGLLCDIGLQIRHSLLQFKNSLEMKRRPVRSFVFLLVLFLTRDEFEVRSEKPNVNKCVGPHCQHQEDNKLPTVIKTL